MLNLKICGFFGCVVAAASALYIFKSTNKKKKKNYALCPGLINTGNSCFLNSLLQALAPSNHFKRWLCQDKNQEKPYGSLQCALSSTIKALNEDSKEHKGKFYNPKAVVSYLHMNGLHNSNNEQKDAYEYYNIMMQALEDETCKQITFAPIFQFHNILSKGTIFSDLTLVNNYFKNCVKINGSKSKKETNKCPFQGTILTQLECRSCGTKFPMKQQKFASLTLNMPKSLYQGLLTIDILLKKHFMLESIDNFRCDVCKVKGSFILRSYIGKMPKSLCLHIQRTSWSESSGTVVKNYQAVTFSEFLSLQPYSLAKIFVKKKDKSDVSFPLVGGENNHSGQRQMILNQSFSQVVYRLKALNHLNNSEFTGIPIIFNSSGTQPKDSPSISPQHVLPPTSELKAWAKAYFKEAQNSIGTVALKTGPLYRLVSVISHLGDADSGHFVTYRRTPASVGLKFPIQWARTSDCDVTASRISDVMAVSPYILIYDRIC